VSLTVVALAFARTGGVKEKTIAARRSGVKRLFFPDGNRKDWEELPDYIREGLEARFVKDYRQIYDVIFADDAAPAQPASSSTTTVVDSETTSTSTPSTKPRTTRRRKATSSDAAATTVDAHKETDLY
jgi:predicted S18 family serine protease